MTHRLRALAAALACAGSLAASATAAQAATLNLAIAGDSYSSGVGAEPYYNSTCAKSSRTYGEVYAKRLRAKGVTVNVTNVACGGAVVKDLDGQIPKLPLDTDLVALTIGGNDVGFAAIVANCFLPAIFDPARCKSQVASGKAKVPAVQTAALARLQALKTRLPKAKVIVISYPYLANPGHYILRGLFNSYDGGQGARELGDLGDQAVINAGNAANAQYGAGTVTFIPTKDLFVGHEPDQDPYKTNKSGWIWEPEGVPSPISLYHPKPIGYEAIATAIERQAGPDLAFGAAH